MFVSKILSRRTDLEAEFCLSFQHVKDGRSLCTSSWLPSARKKGAKEDELKEWTSTYLSDSGSQRVAFQSEALEVGSVLFSRLNKSISNCATNENEYSSSNVAVQFVSLKSTRIHKKCRLFSFF